ncbi:tetratricopeptide repeat protein [Devosia sp. ZB163]|jgi:Flp pilus assembly protein TadD|uniref:tetratricopeptide repeat protein n=1 Tax=Devosia sp. ZB163 TaxID=3025938 RepID=UPI00236284B8|nr:tetratricopeptide repeat protein [Devosia sp. ZB163]MDC9822798.1 tetratricopeptide repeat protein [Devosia sp. ZB163]
MVLGRFGRSVRVGLVAVTLVAGVSVLSACSTAGIGAFGQNKLEVAELSNIGDYTADRALGEAKAHFRNGNYGHSAALYKRAVELSPNDAQAYVGLGASYDRIGRFELADRVYASLYKMTGGTTQYYNNVGYSQMLRGNLSQALTNFQKAQALDPDNLVVANNIQILKDAAASSRA